MSGLRLTTFARDRIGNSDEAALDARAKELDVVVGAVLSTTHHRWTVTVAQGRKRTLWLVDQAAVAVDNDTN